MYRREIRIEFNHCDPAGIVFFPRYFEMLNSQVENFFRDVLDYPFERMMFGDGHAVPTVHFEIDFRHPSKLGELVRFELAIRRLGRTSVDLNHVARGPNGTLRLEALRRLVWIGHDKRSTPWPEPLRLRLAAHMEEKP